MKTTVIPAQITTIEDKIAGNLNLTQILLLLSSLFVATFIYAVFPVGLQLTWYKVPLIILTLITFGILSLRIKGKVVLNWILILTQYNLRPRYYLFDKNDLYLREVIQKSEVIQPIAAKKVKKAKAHEEELMHPLSLSDFVDIEDFLKDKRKAFSFKFNGKGGVHVAVAKVQQ